MVRDFWITLYVAKIQLLANFENDRNLEYILSTYIQTSRFITYPPDTSEIIMRKDSAI